MFLNDLRLAGGPTMVPLSHFIPNPALDIELSPEKDLSRVPTEIGARVMIASADDALRVYLEGRGFLTIEGTGSAYLMRRDFADGALETRPEELARFFANHRYDGENPEDAPY
jgi:hypothetical protein